MTTEQTKALLNDVLQLLQRAKFDVTGADALLVAGVIQTYHKWATDYVETLETKAAQ